MKLLIVTNFFSIFTEDLINNLKQVRNDIEICVLSPDRKFADQKQVDHFIQFDNFRIKRNIIKGAKKYLSWKNTIKKLDDDYDVINLQFAAFFYSFFTRRLKKKTKLFITSIWGSDFYRTSTIKKIIQRKIYNDSHFLTFTNPHMCKNFIEHYGEKFTNKVHICRFGLSALDEIDKLTEKENRENYFNFNNNKFKVVIGCSATEERQHIQILNVLKEQKEMLKKIQFVFPVTYGNKNYIKKLKSYLDNNFKDSDSVFIENYLDISEVAKLRKATDIMINTPVSDQLSGSMLETLYAGNIVINGSWLPYDVLDKKGIYVEKVDSIEEIPDKLNYIIKNYASLQEKSRKNHSIIWKFSSWKENIKSWIHLYEKSQLKR